MITNIIGGIYNNILPQEIYLGDLKLWPMSGSAPYIYLLSNNSIPYYHNTQDMYVFSNTEWDLKYYYNNPRQLLYTSTDGSIINPELIGPTQEPNFNTTIVSNTYNDGVGIITFAEDLTRIGYAFYQNQRLKSIVIPGTVWAGNIDTNSFDDCINLEEHIRFFSRANGTGGEILNGCTNLQYTIVPEGITHLWGYNYKNCPIKEITLPYSLYFIGEYTFYNCYNLTNIKYSGTMYQWNTRVQKYGNWKSGIPATVVHCTDGNVNI